MRSTITTFKRIAMAHPTRVLIGLLYLAGAPLAVAAGPPAAWPMVDRDPVKMELVMQLVVTCTNPEPLGGAAQSKDGKRSEVWPIVGGRFEGKGIRGVVIPGGG